MKKIAAIATLLGAFFMNACSQAPQNPVIEVVTLKLRPGTSVVEFSKVDEAVENQHVSKQRGFISRESAPGADRDWVVIVHWRSAPDADASMKSFASAPAAKQFMAMIEPDTMVMKRHVR